MEPTPGSPKSPASPPAAPVFEKAKPHRGKRFKADEAIDETKLEGRDYGSLLLYYREAVFDKIHRSEDLNKIIRYYFLWSLLFAGTFGAVLGFFSLDLQIVSGAIKLPLLLWGTLAICLPTLFTFNVLLGSKLSMRQTAAVLAMSTYLMSTVLVSLSPIVTFFIISAHDEPFIILLTDLSCSIAGVFGVSLLWNAMGYLTVRSGYDYNASIIRAWTLIYAFVGTQMAWILRPYLGERGEFSWVREVGGNFYSGLYHIIEGMLTR